MITGHTGCGGVRAAMIAATEESMHGSTLPPKTESQKIISEWIEPVSWGRCLSIETKLRV